MPQRMSTSKCAGERSSASSGPTVRANPPSSRASSASSGYDVEKQSVQAKSNIGFVPDHYALYEKLTAREYVNYIADLYAVPKAERDERMNFYVEIFELQKAVDEPISTYSHGMKQ